MTTTPRRARPLPVLSLWLLASACGPVPAEAPAAEPVLNSPAEHVHDHADAPESAEEPIGEEAVDPDPLDVEDDCASSDRCDVPPVLADAAEVEEPAPPEATPGEPAEDVEPAASTAGPVAGSAMITRAYTAFRRSPSSGAALLSVEPHGGVADDARHPYRNPRGVIPPGQLVRLVQVERTNGYLRVTYDGATGWMSASRLAWVKPGVSRVALARQPEVRNAFFKHQLRRTRFNKDGPLRSGNCAPASLAMAARIFGAEPAGLSVEESIHRARRQYDAGLNEGDGTSRLEIENAARKLGLRVNPLRTDVSPSAALNRLDAQLAQGRAVVLVGMPGRAGAGPTLYEQAFNRAYAAARASGVALTRGTYDFNGGHSIVVTGKDTRGRYIVGDPLSEVGFITLTGAEMKDFMSRYAGARGIGNAVWK